LILNSESAVAMQAAKSLVSDEIFSKLYATNAALAAVLAFPYFSCCPDAATTTTFDVRSPLHENHNTGVYLLDTVACLLRS
jgi:hypothetical protein